MSQTTYENFGNYSKKNLFLPTFLKVILQNANLWKTLLNGIVKYIAYADKKIQVRI